MTKSIRCNVITAKKIFNAFCYGFWFIGWNQRRQNGIKRADFQMYGEDIGTERAITSFLAISFNNSELRDGKLSISGVMDVIAGTFLAPLMGTDQRLMSKLGCPLVVHYWRWSNQSAASTVWVSLETLVFSGFTGFIWARFLLFLFSVWSCDAVKGD